MQRFVDLLARFHRDERGVFMVIFAVLAVVLIATSGAVVDFTYTQQARTRAQTALDAATLALQSKINTLSNDTLKAQAQDILDERLGDDTITAIVDSATKNVAEGKLNITAHIVVPTAFVQLVGISSITSRLQSEVTRSSSDLEVSVSLDVTGSMKATTDKKGNITSDKIGDLITATNDLIDLLVQNVQEPTYSKMAIIPWSAGVNVGATYAVGCAARPTPAPRTSLLRRGRRLVEVGRRRHPWQEHHHQSSSHGVATGDTIYISGISGVATGGRNSTTCINNAAYVITKVDNNNFSIPLNTNNCTNYSSGGTLQKCQVAKCEMVITATGHGYKNGDPIHIAEASWLKTQPSGGYFVANSTTNTMSLEGSFGPSEDSYKAGGKIWCGSYGCSYRTFYAADGSINSYALTTCVSERTTAPYTDAAPSTTLLGMNYRPSSQCISQTVQPLTADKDKLHALANSLVASGSTAGHLGLAWGWYMISPNFGYLWPTASQPAAYGTTNLIKAVVFMTDGQFNTPYCSGVIAADGLSGSGGANTHINCNAPNGASKAQAEQLCDAIKAPANKTLLYVVGFDLATDTTTLNFLRDCATAPEYFFQADSGADLRTAFAAIAQSLSDLRLSSRGRGQHEAPAARKAGQRGALLAQGQADEADDERRFGRIGPARDHGDAAPPCRWRRGAGARRRTDHHSGRMRSFRCEENAAAARVSTRPRETAAWPGALPVHANPVQEANDPGPRLFLAAPRTGFIVLNVVVLVLRRLGRLHRRNEHRGARRHPERHARLYRPGAARGAVGGRLARLGLAGGAPPAAQTVARTASRPAARRPRTATAARLPGRIRRGRSADSRRRARRSSRRSADPQAGRRGRCAQSPSPRPAPRPPRASRRNAAAAPGLPPRAVIADDEGQRRQSRSWRTLRRSPKRSTSTCTKAARP